MSKSTVIYHRADFDGLFSGAVCAQFLPDAKLIGWDFGDPLIPWPEGTVYVVDLPPSCIDGFALLSDSRADSLIWIDHHKSSMDSFDENLRGYRIDGVAACRLCWAWLMAEHNDPVHGALPAKAEFVNRQVKEPLALTLAGEYDVWDKRDPRAEAFQFGLTANRADFDKNPYEIVRLLQWGNDVAIAQSARSTEEVCDLGRGALRWQAAFAEQVCRERSYTRDWEGLRFCILGSPHARNSMWFPQEAIPIGCDALMCWRYDGQRVTFSLYHAPGHEEHDLSPIAVKYGGGGHRGACGFTMGLEDAMRVVA